MGDARIGLLLALADDELVLGHRLSEWTGWVPYLEADLALSSIAQDELGHARALYRLAVSLGAAASEDELALGRPAGAYRHARLCSHPNVDLAFSLARHWLYDRADRVRLEALREGSFDELIELIAVIELEEGYHRSHADAWFERLVSGPVEGRRRFLEALAYARPLADELFDPVEDEPLLLAEGVMTASSAELLARFRTEIDPILDEAGIGEIADREPGEVVPTAAGAIEMPDGSASASPAAARNASPGRASGHDEHFAALWDEMTALYRSEPGATW